MTANLAHSEEYFENMAVSIDTFLATTFLELLYHSFGFRPVTC